MALCCSERQWLPIITNERDYRPSPPSFFFSRISDVYFYIRPSINYVVSKLAFFYPPTEYLRSLISFIKEIQSKFEPSFLIFISRPILANERVRGLLITRALDFSSKSCISSLFRFSNASMNHLLCSFFFWKGPILSKAHVRGLLS